MGLLPLRAPMWPVVFVVMQPGREGGQAGPVVGGGSEQRPTPVPGSASAARPCRMAGRYGRVRLWTTQRRPGPDRTPWTGSRCRYRSTPAPPPSPSRQTTPAPDRVKPATVWTCSSGWTSRYAPASSRGWAHGQTHSPGPGCLSAAGALAPMDAVATAVGLRPACCVQVDQLAGPLTLRAHHLPGGAVRIGQARDAIAAQHGMHGGMCLAQRPANAVGPTEGGIPRTPWRATVPSVPSGARGRGIPRNRPQSMLSRHRFPASGRRAGEAVAALAGPLNEGRLLQIGKPIIDPGLLPPGRH